ncbi:MAG: flagellar filament outer layer protein FlaA [Spirochaetaceae bacterium]|jgi:hypothetical protein|nr:flagellar filament outer layer protein FlaA [Spirochaetaceae bacterium]
MKKSIAILICFSLVLAAFAQTGQTSLADSNIPDDTAGNALTEVSVDLFEREGSWVSSISPDNGLVSSRLFEGSPAAKTAYTTPEGETPPDTKVLGVKVQFYRRGVNTFYVKAASPIPITGVVKTISFWVTGRNQAHRISLIVRDYFSHIYELYVGDLAFAGWKQLRVTIPPSPDGERGIVQSSPYYGDHPGLSIVGFKIDCNPVEARGTYYLYFDDLRAVTDVYDYNNPDTDSMQDNW